jgi:hypothetical protein
MGGASMIASYKQKAKIAGGICAGSLVGLVILGRVLAATGHLSDTGTFDEGNTAALLVDSTLSIAFAVSLFYGVWMYLAAKGRSASWLLLLCTGLGWIVILLLKDHAKDGKEPAPQEYFG